MLPEGVMGPQEGLGLSLFLWCTQQVLMLSVLTSPVLGLHRVWYSHPLALQNGLPLEDGHEGTLFTLLKEYAPRRRSVVLLAPDNSAPRTASHPPQHPAPPSLKSK